MSEPSKWSSLQDEEAALEALGRHELAGDALEQLYSYSQMLQEFDAHTNLVANSNLPVLLKEHVLDSLQLVPTILASKKPPRLIDIGSGAGFPGMVLAIACPELKVTLVDSIGKKCRFLEGVVEGLELGNRVRVLCDRAETLGHDKRYRDRFEFATARAVAALPVVVEICMPFLTLGGKLLAQRSKRQADLEQSEAEAYASRLGGCLKDTIHFDPDLLGREMSLMLIQKLKPTPSRYPRTAAEIKREHPRK